MSSVLFHNNHDKEKPTLNLPCPSALLCPCSINPPVSRSAEDEGHIQPIQDGTVNLPEVLLQYSQHQEYSSFTDVLQGFFLGPLLCLSPNSDSNLNPVKYHSLLIITDNIAIAPLRSSPLTCIILININQHT